MTELSFSEIQDLRNCLANYMVTVTFNKTNGDLRSMLCTTNGDMIFASTEKNAKPDEKPKSVKKPGFVRSNTEVMAVWDLEKAGWRSFRWDSVISTMVHS